MPTWISGLAATTTSFIALRFYVQPALMRQRLEEFAGALGIERLHQQQMNDERHFDDDFLSLEILDRSKTWRADDHVAALDEIEQRNDLALGTVRAGDERVRGNERHGVHLPSREGID